MNESSSSILNSNGSKLLYEDAAVPLNIYQQGQYSAGIAELNVAALTQLAYPGVEKRPPIKELAEMAERDPVVANCISLKALRAVSSFGNFSHPKKEIESFVNSNLNTQTKSIKRTLFKAISNVILYGFCIIEFTFTSKARGFHGQWRLHQLNVLNPERIKNFTGKNGKIEFIEYDNGNGKITRIPYEKCIHVINNSGTTFEESELWGIGDGIAALNYYKLKRVVLTQMALATKNNSTGIVHAKAPNNGRTGLVDSKMIPLKDSKGKPIEVTKQIALNYQLQDLYKKDYIVTDSDVTLERIQIQNSEGFWEYILGYIDRAIQTSFKIPTGIFDAGTSGMQNIGLSQNYKSVFDSTIFALTNLLKEELLNKVIKKLLCYNFPFDWIKDNYGEFVFDVEEDQQTINSRLSTIASLIASGILDQNNVEIISLINKNLGLPALREEDKLEKDINQQQQKITQALQKQLEEMQLQLQQLQIQTQAQELQNPATSIETDEEYPPEA